MEELRKKIEKKAYEYYLLRGKAHGQALDDWLKAEKDIMGAAGNQKSSQKVTIKKKK